MNRIEDSFDNLSAAVCMFDRRGVVRMVNRRMLEVSAMLLGSGVQTLPELREALRCPPEGISADTETPDIYRFPDGSVLRFSEKEIRDSEGTPYTEVVAADVAELMVVRTRLHEENERLNRANRQLRQLGENMADIVREEEILNMKIRVHDEIGHTLLAVQKAARECEDIAQLHRMAEQWRTSIQLLRGDESEKTGDPIVLAQAKGKELGVQVVLIGTFPQTDSLREIMAHAIRECTSNCLRHARGSKIVARCGVDNGFAVLRIINDGDPPGAPIREGGGLTGLRRRIEQAGGKMETAYSPQFFLELSIPFREDRV